MARSMTKAKRFRIFKRDMFCCQYCGQKPPAVILEVDHIIAVSNGGDDHDSNLITACFDCNRGKGAEPLEIVPQSLSERAEAMAERQEQVTAYERLVKSIKRSLDKNVGLVKSAFKEAYPDRRLSPKGKNTVRTFLEKLPPSDVIFAMEKAVSKPRHHDDAFKYFCGVCWSIIKGKRW